MEKKKEMTKEEWKAYKKDFMKSGKKAWKAEKKGFKKFKG